jgi:hypothetical protein
MNEQATVRRPQAANGRATEQLPMVIAPSTDLSVTESSIKEIITNSTVPMVDVVNGVADVIRDVEAEVSVDEDITITHKAIRIQRSMRLAKDRRS